MPIILIRLIVWLFTLCLTVPVISQEIFDDPSQDGWESEAASALLQTKLKKMVGNYLVSGKLDQIKIQSEAKSGLVRESDFELIERDELFTRKAIKLEYLPIEPTVTFEEGFKKILGSISNTSEQNEAYFRLKVSEIVLKDTVAQTKVLFYAASKGVGKRTQINSSWNVTWSISSDHETVSLQSLEILSHEELTLDGDKKWFADATLALFEDDKAFTEQLQKGVSSWLNEIERFAGSNIYSRHGFAIGDVNGDGLDDLYICQPGGLPNRLFLKQNDGTLVDQSLKSGLDILDETRSSLFVDLDNDGDQDLVLGSFVGVYLYENNGNAVFKNKGKLLNLERDVNSLSAVDYDNDGKIDIFTSIYWSDKQLNGKVGNVFDQNTKGGTNKLFKNQVSNDGEWSFVDVTEESGLMVNNQRYTLAASWEDFDHDGDQDLYIANDFGKNNLFQNNGEGSFIDIAKAQGLEDYGPSMSVSWGDFNRDEKPDLYVANMFSSAGNRVVPQANFSLDKSFGLSTESLLRFNKGNSLYSFNGNDFDEMPQSNGAENALWAWSSILADIDNDGWQDALVANGYISGPGGGDL